MPDRITNSGDPSTVYGEFSVEDWRVRPGLNRIEREGEVRRLEPKSMLVLVYLAARPREVRSKRRILKAVWGDAFVSDEVLTHAVWELRKAFGDSAKAPRFIETIPRRGYRFVGVVSHGQEEADATGRSESVAERGAQEKAEEPLSARPVASDQSGGSSLVGRTISHFEVRELIGEGGMGRVFRATDTRLGREVALKVLQGEFALSSERKARFVREARALASLNHPNIATLYDYESVKGLEILVMELVEGEALAARIARGPLSLEEALTVFGQIAEGLEAAHGYGIVHRDLKPANVHICDGRVKILDFGLAKLLLQSETSPPSDGRPSDQSLETVQGKLLGTVPYMSPEQATGQAVGAQTDVWAFGCCLFEALVGSRAFEAANRSETVVRILNGEPSMDELARVAPSRIVELVERCLQRDLRDRLHHIGDARLELAATARLDDLADGWAVRSKRVSSSDRFSGWTSLAVAALVGAIAVGSVVWQLRLPASRDVGGPRVLSAIPPAGVQLWTGIAGSLDLSPGGADLVFVGQSGAGDLMLYHRSLADPDSRPIAGTEGARGPFFSPDGRWVGFHAGGQIRKVSLAGGHPEVVCQSLVFLGATWLEDNSIVFSDQGSLMRVESSGRGAPRAFATADLQGGEHFRSPASMPGVDEVLVTAATDRSGQVERVSLTTGKRTPLVKGDYPFVRYADPGYLLYADKGSVFAALLPSTPGAELGPRRLLREGIATSHDGSGGLFAVSQEGTLAYVSPLQQATTPRRYLVTRDRDGREVRLDPEPRWFTAPRLSPDGSEVAVTIIETSRRFDVWIYGVRDRSRRRLTIEGNNKSAAWSPDGKRVAFASFRNGLPSLYTKPVAGGEAHWVKLAFSEGDRALYRYPSAWSPDGKLLAFDELRDRGDWDLLTVPVAGGEPTVLAGSPANEFGGRFSPDGAWIAYVSDRSGEEEVYVRRFPGQGGGEWKVSEGGGVFPVWSQESDEIFFVGPDDEVLTVPVQTEGAFVHGQPKTLFSYPGGFSPRSPLTEFDASADGEVFSTWQGGEAPPSNWTLELILDWAADPRIARTQ